MIIINMKIAKEKYNFYNILDNQDQDTESLKTGSGG